MALILAYDLTLEEPQALEDRGDAFCEALAGTRSVQASALSPKPTAPGRRRRAYRSKRRQRTGR